MFQDLHADRTPLGRVLGKTLTAGWQVLGIGTFQSGLPFTVYSGIQQTGVGSMGADRPGSNRNAGSFHQPHGARGLLRSGRQQCFLLLDSDRCARRNRPQSAASSAHSAEIHSAAPDCMTSISRLIKDTPLARKGAAARARLLQFRAEFFNVFNIVNFGLPSNILLGPGFGEISRTASNSRQIQFSMKVIY